MVIRKLTLAEWFLTYQLHKIKEDHFQLPGTLRIDISSLEKGPSLQQQKVPLNALVLKALGEWLAEEPLLNRIFFKTWKGPRFLEFPEVRINFPIEIEAHGKKAIAAIVIKDPHLKSVQQIHLEIKEAKNQNLKKFPINNFLYSRNNFFWNRWLLKALYFLAMKSPQFYFKNGGGGVTFSSVTHARNPEMVLVPMAFGPTGFTLCLNSLENTDERTYLHFGINFDHYCHNGASAAIYVEKLSRKMVKVFSEFSKDAENGTARRVGSGNLDTPML